ncbi:H/ACA ribonucleoprotein complex subunit GAR1 [archaeon]
MRSLGSVIGKSASGFAIIRCNPAPKLKARVFNKNNKKVGFVADIVGPVDEPFVLIKSNSKPGQELFVGD